MECNHRRPKKRGCVRSLLAFIGSCFRIGPCFRKPAVFPDSAEDDEMVRATPPSLAGSEASPQSGELLASPEFGAPAPRRDSSPLNCTIGPANFLPTIQELVPESFSCIAAVTVCDDVKIDSTGKTVPLTSSKQGDPLAVHRAKVSPTSALLCTPAGTPLKAPHSGGPSPLHSRTVANTLKSFNDNTQAPLTGRPTSAPSHLSDGPTPATEYTWVKSLSSKGSVLTGLSPEEQVDLLNLFDIHKDVDQAPRQRLMCVIPSEENESEEGVTLKKTRMYVANGAYRMYPSTARGRRSYNRALVRHGLIADIEEVKKRVAAAGGRPWSAHPVIRSFVAAPAPGFILREAVDVTVKAADQQLGDAKVEDGCIEPSNEEVVDLTANVDVPTKPADANKKKTRRGRGGKKASKTSAAGGPVIPKATILHQALTKAALNAAPASPKQGGDRPSSSAASCAGSNSGKVSPTSALLCTPAGTPLKAPHSGGPSPLHSRKVVHTLKSFNDSTQAPLTGRPTSAPSHLSDGPTPATEYTWVKSLSSKDSGLSSLSPEEQINLLNLFDIHKEEDQAPRQKLAHAVPSEENESEQGLKPKYYVYPNNSRGRRLYNRALVRHDLVADIEEVRKRVAAAGGRPGSAHPVVRPVAVAPAPKAVLCDAVDVEVEPEAQQLDHGNAIKAIQETETMNSKAAVLQRAPYFVTDRAAAAAMHCEMGAASIGQPAKGRVGRQGRNY